MPAVRQKRPKQASTACHASSMRGVTARVRGMVVLVMALLSLKESTAGAYGLGASNAAARIPTSIGTSPGLARPRRLLNSKALLARNPTPRCMLGYVRVNAEVARSAEAALTQATATAMPPA